MFNNFCRPSQCLIKPTGYNVNGRLSNQTFRFFLTTRNLTPISGLLFWILKGIWQIFYSHQNNKGLNQSSTCDIPFFTKETTPIWETKNYNIMMTNLLSLYLQGSGIPLTTEWRSKRKVFFNLRCNLKEYCMSMRRRHGKVFDNNLTILQPTVSMLVLYIYR